MKALTLSQPWATLVSIGIKRIETRGWQTTYRGPLAIHAGKGIPGALRGIGDGPAFQYALRGVRGPLPRGVVLCICDLVAIHPVEQLVNQLDLGFTTGGDELLSQFQFGDFAPGRFAWILTNLRTLKTPVPARGAQSLWQWEERKE